MYITNCMLKLQMCFCRKVFCRVNFRAFMFECNRLHDQNYTHSSYLDSHTNTIAYSNLKVYMFGLPSIRMPFVECYKCILSIVYIIVYLPKSTMICNGEKQKTLDKIFKFFFKLYFFFNQVQNSVYCRVQF